MRADVISVHVLFHKWKSRDGSQIASRPASHSTEQQSQPVRFLKQVNWVKDTLERAMGGCMAASRVGSCLESSIMV